MEYSRYESFISDGKYKRIPFIEIPKMSSDIYVEFDANRMRLDLLSYQYYDDPRFGWLILQANPSVGSLEFRIVDGSYIRIPYPLESALNNYESEITKYEKYYGLE